MRAETSYKCVSDRALFLRGAISAISEVNNYIPFCHDIFG